MVGLVLVSHSRAIATGLADLVQQMAGDIPLAAVGGTADGRLGTDPMGVLEAIRRVWSPDGVLILVDLGSSVMSAETAMDMLTRDEAQGVVLSGAPLVEGAVAAGVEIGLGRPLAQVQEAAESACRQPKF